MSVEDFLTDLVLERGVAKIILDYKHGMEHKEKMEKVCKEINGIKYKIFMGCGGYMNSERTKIYKPNVSIKYEIQQGLNIEVRKNGIWLYDEEIQSKKYVIGVTDVYDCLDDYYLFAGEDGYTMQGLLADPNYLQVDGNIFIQIREFYRF